MDQYLSFVTLAVPDLNVARRFYVTGLGWTPEHHGDDVVFIRLGPGLMLSLWELAGFRAEVGQPHSGLAPMTLAHNVADPAAVDAVLQTARDAGAVVTPAEQRSWGGYTGYFTDPAGFVWEVAHNPHSPDLVDIGRQWAQQYRQQPEH